MARKLVFKKAVVKKTSGNGINVNSSQPPIDISSGDVPEDNQGQSGTEGGEGGSEPSHIDEPTYVTVTFDANGGSPERTIIKVDPNGKISALPEPNERTGYEFQGWYPSPEGNGQCLTTSTIIDSDRTYYAIWFPQTCYIVYDAQGGTSWESAAVPYMSEVEELSNATRPGYDFLGWFTEPNGGTQITAGYVMTNLDGMTVYAHWRKIDEGGEEEPEPPDILDDPEVQQRFEEIREQYPFPDGFTENTEEEVEEIDQELENELDDEEDQTPQLCETNEDDENDDSWNDLFVETPEWALVRRANI